MPCRRPSFGDPLEELSHSLQFSAAPPAGPLPVRIKEHGGAAMRRCAVGGGGAYHQLTRNVLAPSGDHAMTPTEETAFPRLTSTELALVKPLAKPCDYADGDVVFRAGQPDIDLYVVESGRMEIRNPTDGGLVIAVHEPGHFSGDIDVLTGRPVIVTAVAKGPTRLLCVPHGQLRALLNRVPSLGEKMILAF